MFLDCLACPQRGFVPKFVPSLQIEPAEAPRCGHHCVLAVDAYRSSLPSKFVAPRVQAWSPDETRVCVEGEKLRHSVAALPTYGTPRHSVLEQKLELVRQLVFHGPRLDPRARRSIESARACQRVIACGRDTVIQASVVCCHQRGSFVQVWVRANGLNARSLGRSLPLTTAVLVRSDAGTRMQAHKSSLVTFTLG